MSIRFVFIFLFIIFLSSILILYQIEYRHSIILPPLVDHLYPVNFSSHYENIVLLSCSSYSYTYIYCYYIPYIALAWRRIGFEPIIYLVGSDEIFQKMPLLDLLKNDLRIKYYFLNVDQSRSISASQVMRLFAGFISYEYKTTKDLFILISDADLLPISRDRFRIDTNDTNYILAVNAYCCPQAEFSYEDFQNIHYYPISYIGMNKYLWKQIFSPFNNCYVSSKITIDLIECFLQERMNVTLPKNVIKGAEQWDIDQKLISLLIARAERLLNTYVDKRKLGYRLDPDKNFVSSEFNSILLYDDVHLPNQQENIIFNNQTWSVLSKAFSSLFHNKTIQLLSRYHFETAAIVLGSNNTTKQENAQK